MSDAVDVVLVNPGNAARIYQGLSVRYAAVEPPTWALLLAEAMRSKGHRVRILDANAERLLPEDAAERIESMSPRLVCLVVYGQNVNAGTVGMSGAVALAEAVKAREPRTVIGLIGSYAQALPAQVLRDEPCFDFAFTNEGVYALAGLLEAPDFTADTLAVTRGIAWRAAGGEVVINPAERVVPTELMDRDLPGYAWDLLPYSRTPLDVYRSPMWHAEYDERQRSPYAAIQTSLGCAFACSFCMINILNRDDEEEVGIAGNYALMRFWSPEFVLAQIDQLVGLGVHTIKITDEMFLLKRRHYEPLCRALSERSYSEVLRMWAYSRIDTVRNPELLALLRAAGIRWLALGIESASRSVRLEVSKGKFEDVDIPRVIAQVHEAGIEVMANYIVGLPGDTEESVEQTLALATSLATAGFNVYPAMALPGSELHAAARRSGADLPRDYIEYSFHSYECRPLGTETLTPAEVLRLRDRMYQRYHASDTFQDRVRSRFGEAALASIIEMNSHSLPRRLIEEAGLT